VIMALSACNPGIHSRQDKPGNGERRH
jgi:hypothetical protein